MKYILILVWLISIVPSTVLLSQSLPPEGSYQDTCSTCVVWGASYPRTLKCAYCKREDGTRNWGASLELKDSRDEDYIVNCNGNLQHVSC